MAGSETGDLASHWQEVILGLAGVGSFLGMIASGFKGKEHPPEAEPSSHLMLEAASLADTRPMMARLDKLGQTLERIAVACEALKQSGSDTLSCMREWMKAEEDRRERLEREADQEARMARKLDNALAEIKRLAESERKPDHGK